MRLLLRCLVYFLVLTRPVQAQEVLPACRYNWSTSGAGNIALVSCQNGYTDDNGVASGGSCRLVPSDGSTAIACANGYTDSNGIAAGGTCIGLATATGGTITSTMTSGDIQYRVHTFHSNGSLVTNGTMAVDILLVGGGGGGGLRAGGGGGGGGVLYTTGYSLAPGTYAVTVGAGGTASTSVSVAGGTGGSSILGNLTALGGGGGGSSGASAGTTGGAGGGAAGGDINGRGLGTVGQGNSGGGGSASGIDSYLAGGGGGGGGNAGASATQTSPAIAGSGGAGTTSTITGAQVIYGGGGGGGAAVTAETGGLGGNGGGGAGSKGAVAATAGTANTGGGGGGGGYDTTSNGAAGNGGSGVVIIRYPITSCSTDYIDSNGSASDGTCISSLVTTGTGNACDAGFTDSNGTMTGGSCTPNTVTIGTGTACDSNFTDSNGPATGGSCVSNTVTTGAGAVCDSSSFDTNGNTTGGSCGAILASCASILSTYPTAPSGTYHIYRSSTKFAVYCDMTTDSGGYTYYPVDSGLQTYRTTDNNTCKGLGMDIVAPRTQAHWDAMLSRYGTTYFSVVPGVYKSSGGGSYTNCIMRSPAHYASGCADWTVVGGGKWWLRDTTYGEPNGDYTANCWLNASWSGSTVATLGFNDGNCSFSTTKYICSTNDKP